MSDELIYEQDGHIVTVTLNRPEQRNALSYTETFQAFEDVCARIQSDLSVRCVIITGKGSAFSAGGNVKQMKERAGIFGGAPMKTRESYRTGIQRIPLAVWELEVPTIAAVNGPAVGAGCDLACMCDIRIASESAFFAESFVKLGIIPGDGGAYLLPRAVGLSRAAEMTFTGDRVDGKTAAAWGLASRCVAPEQLMPEARALAERIAVNPPEVLRMAKRLLREGQKTDLRGVLELSAAFQSLAHQTEDHTEAVDAFLEKRTPTFTGN
ncbi:crotonase/enoyl-CoA hydratase family protein [Minwuia sp.]|uniref:crotonase/enoyl-CoA hydratase family protein n=1 Tax=Minwuia sp. TaxID=2493630 RepID=UPI003A907A1E